MNACEGQAAELPTQCEDNAFGTTAMFHVCCIVLGTTIIKNICEIITATSATSASNSHDTWEYILDNDE